MNKADSVQHLLRPPMFTGSSGIADKSALYPGNVRCQKRPYKGVRCWTRSLRNDQGREQDFHKKFPRISIVQISFLLYKNVVSQGCHRDGRKFGDWLRDCEGTSGVLCKPISRPFLELEVPPKPMVPSRSFGKKSPTPKAPSRLWKSTSSATSPSTRLLSRSRQVPDTSMLSSITQVCHLFVVFGIWWVSLNLSIRLDLRHRVRQG